MPFICNMKRLIRIIIFACLSAIIFSSACDTNIIVDEDHVYYIEGSIVKNSDLDIASVTLYLERDQAIYSLMDISIEQFSLGYDAVENLYFVDTDSADAFPQGQYNLNIEDSTWLDYTYIDTLSFNPVITITSLPEDRGNPGGMPVQMIWQLALNNDGYIIATTLKDSVYNNYGYSDFVSDGVNQATLPLSAFRLSGELDTGWYYVYVYSFTGSPSFGRNLPVHLPDGFLNNISATDITGMFGTVVVSPHDSIHVTLQ